LHFKEFQNLLRYYNFELDNIKGSHFNYSNDNFKRNISIQEKKGYAKKYQVRIFLKIPEKNNAS